MSEEGSVLGCKARKSSHILSPRGYWRGGLQLWPSPGPLHSSVAGPEGLPAPSLVGLFAPWRPQLGPSLPPLLGSASSDTRWPEEEEGAALQKALPHGALWWGHEPQMLSPLWEDPHCSHQLPAPTSSLFSHLALSGSCLQQCCPRLPPAVPSLSLLNTDGRSPGPALLPRGPITLGDAAI